MSILLVTVLSLVSLSAAFADDSTQSCPYDGAKPKQLVDKLHSKEFRDSLSPFNKLLLDAIPSDDFFFKLFDTSFKKGTEERTFFLNCVYWDVKMGLECPIKKCKKTGEKAGKAFENNLTPLDYFEIVGSTLESSLKEENNLDNSTGKNTTRDLIKSFISDVAKYLCKPDVKGPTEALFALDDGSIEFFRSVGATSKKDAAFVGMSFGNQFAKFAETDIFVLVPVEVEI